ncbi:MAG: hypothetical protein ACHQ5A_00940 [Opitutales bacterium]
MPAAPRAQPRRGGVMLKLLLLLAGVLAAGALAWMALLPYALTSWVRDRTGFDVAVDTLMVNPLTGRIHARGLVLGNPPTFPRTEFLQVREFAVDADLATLFSAKPVLRHVTLDVALIALVKRADGRTNLEVFRDYLADQAEAGGGGTLTRQKSFQIRRLDVRFDRLLLADYTRSKPVVRDYPLRYIRTFTNVNDSRKLLLPTSLDQLYSLGGAVGSLLPEEAGRIVDEAMRSGEGMLKSVPPPNTRAMNGYSDALEESKKP